MSLRIPDELCDIGDPIPVIAVGEPGEPVRLTDVAGRGVYPHPRPHIAPLGPGNNNPTAFPPPPDGTDDTTG